MNHRGCIIYISYSIELRFAMFCIAWKNLPPLPEQEEEGEPTAEDYLQWWPDYETAEQQKAYQAAEEALLCSSS
jgi:hypothetical protein